MTIPSASSGGALAALRHKDFRRFWIAALISNSGSWMQGTAIPFVVYEIAGRNSSVGFTGFWQYFPIMLFGALGGSLADRFPRRAVLVVTQIVQALTALLLWWEVRSPDPQVAAIGVIVFAGGLASGLNVPVWQAFVSDLVPRSVLANAVTLNSTQFNAARFVGPLVAGIVLAVSSAANVFLLNAASYVVVLGALAVVRGSAVPATEHHGVVERLRLGVHDIWSKPALRAACGAIAVVAGVGSPLFSFLSAEYGQEILRVDGARLGLLIGSAGLGAVLFSPWLLANSTSMRAGRVLTVAMAVYGAGVIGMGLSRSYWLSVVSGLVFGAAYLAIATSLNTTVQLVADDRIRGTTISVYLMCLTGALPIGLLVWGQLADLVGLRQVTIGAGVILVVFAMDAFRRGRFDPLDAASAVS